MFRRMFRRPSSSCPASPASPATARVTVILAVLAGTLLLALAPPHYAICTRGHRAHRSRDEIAEASDAAVNAAAAAAAVVVVVALSLGACRPLPLLSLPSLLPLLGQEGNQAEH